ncbi:AAA family ATPase [Reinekea marina]|uniref:AAA family ATPase n=1 Tax=Reinekea marina TaxID=1310421 RepID=A0ABV7WXD6_9GAMM
MSTIVIFGNSGSGKSSLAKKLAKKYQLAHLDLDTVAWQPIMPPERKAIEESENQIIEFIESRPNWVIEGCYSDLLKLVMPKASEIIFLNLPISECIDNARNRPWEPHKYESKAAQDANLDMLISWITDYNNRTDTFSKVAHEKLYRDFNGKKTELVANVSDV